MTTWAYISWGVNKQAQCVAPNKASLKYISFVRQLAASVARATHPPFMLTWVLPVTIASSLKTIVCCVSSSKGIRPCCSGLGDLQTCSGLDNFHSSLIGSAHCPCQWEPQDWCVISQRKMRWTRVSGAWLQTLQGSEGVMAFDKLQYSLWKGGIN